MRVGCVDDLVWVIGPTRDEYHVTRLDWQMLPGNAKRPYTFQNDEHFLLRMVKVVRTSAFSWLQDVIRRAEFLGSCTPS